MVWQTLTDNPEVFYGAVLSLVIVVLLTPAVGGMARVLGVVDRPGARRVNRGSVPRLGGPAPLFGGFLPAVGVPPLGRGEKGLLLGVAGGPPPRAVGHFPGPRLGG